MWYFGIKASGPSYVKLDMPILVDMQVLSYPVRLPIIL